MRTTTRTPTALGLLAAATLALTACGGGEGSSSSAGEEPSPEQTSPEQVTTGPDLEGIPEVVAEVNGEEVTREEFVAVYEAQFQQASMQAQMGGEAPDEDALKEQTANGLVDSALLEQEAEARDFSASEADVDTELETIAQQNQLGSAQALLDALEKQGTTEEQARDQVETQVLVEQLVADEAGDIRPTEQELRALYEQTKQQAAAQQGQQQEVPPFGRVRAQLEEQAVAQEQGQVAQALVEDLRQDADITINL